MELKISGVSKSFKSDGIVNSVLKGVSFEVKEGEFVSLLGPSGCGKTTLLTMIAGFKKADEGEILLNGSKVVKPGPDRGFVFQNYALFPWKTVKKNILYPMEQLKFSKSQKEERLNYLLKVSQLEGKSHLYPHQLSGGMKQRTAVVRALASKPQVLLMDEPLGAIDFQMRKEIQEELESIWMKDRTTVVMVTHDVEEAVYLSDRVIVMSNKDGNIVADVSIDMVRPRDRESESYIKYKNDLIGFLQKKQIT